MAGSTGTGSFVGSNTPTLTTPILLAATGSSISLSGNISSQNFISGYRTTVSSATPIVLVNSSAYAQYITGSTAQTIVMPLTSTLTNVANNAESYLIANNSSATTTVNSSGGNLIISLPPGTQSVLTCILNTGTTAASWSSDFISNVPGVTFITGTPNQVLVSPSTGSVTLSLPQNINTSAAVTFASVSVPNNNGILDSNGNLLLAAGGVASPVNYILIRNSATNNGPRLVASGSDTNIAFNILGQGTSGVNLYGVSDGSNAPVGYVGEYYISKINAGGAISLTTSTAVDITTLTLTAGEWDIYGNVTFLPANTTAQNYTYVWTSLTSATLPNYALITGQSFPSAGTVTGVAYYGSCAPFLRVAISATTTVYLSCQAQFSVAGMSACGTISARRAR